MKNALAQVRIALGAVRQRTFPYLVARMFLGRKVCAGPFKGMCYHGRAVGSAASPKLRGSYELELAAAVEALALWPGLRRLVDVGAAEGYYAIGLLRRLPYLTCVAFEGDARGRRYCARLAVANKVSARLDLQGYCRVDDLNRVLVAGDAVLMDVEGGEVELLDPRRVRRLEDLPVLVEIHDAAVPEAGELTKARFRRTHRIQVIGSAQRPAVLHGTKWYGTTLETLWQEEWRGQADNYWLWMTPRQDRDQSPAGANRAQPVGA